MGGISQLMFGSGGTSSASVLPTQQQNIGKETQDTLQAEINAAPQEASAYQQYSPQYAQTDVSTLGKSLFGTNYNGDLSDINQKLTDQSNQQTLSSNSALRQGNLNATQTLAPQYQQALQSANPQLFAGLASQQAAANRGVQQDAAQGQMNNLAFYSPAYNPVQLNQVQGQNVGVMGVGAQNVYAPQGNSTLWGMSNAYNQNPGISQTQTTADQQAQGLLAQGGNLSPDELRQVQQTSRAADAARGLDASNGSIVNEAMNTDAAMRARQIQNISTAEGIESQSQAERQAQQQYGLGLSGQQQQYGAMGLAAQQGNQAAQLTAGTANQSALLNAGLANQANSFQTQSANNANALAQQQANLQSQNQQYNQLGQSAGLDYGRQAQNFSMGQTALGNYQANVFDPEAAVVGQNSTNAGSNASLFGVGGGANANSSAVMNMFNPQSSYASALNNSNASLTNQANIVSAQNKNSQINNTVSSDTSIANSIIGKI